MHPPNPEIGHSIQCGDILTNYLDIGNTLQHNTPVLLLHGSGPGVSAWANWRGVLAALGDRFRLLAPDLAGFGYTQIPDGLAYSRKRWLQQILDMLDALGILKVHVIGNSFGGSIALALAIRSPQRVQSLVLMGSVGVPFALTPGLDAVWGYTPSMSNMRDLMRDVFAHDPKIVTDALIQARYQASLRTQDTFSAMFPAPRQRWVDAMAHPLSAIMAITHPTLLVHGRDDNVIPLSTSLTLHRLIDNSQLHVFGRCGHWTQIEKNVEFCRLLRDFFHHGQSQ